MTGTVDQNAKRARIEASMTNGVEAARSVPLDNKWYLLLPVTVPLDVATSPVQFVVFISSLRNEGRHTSAIRVAPAEQSGVSTNNVTH